MFVSDNEYIVHVDFMSSPWANWMISMNTTASLTTPNSIVNISSSTAGGGNIFGVMEYMSDTNDVGFLWC